MTINYDDMLALIADNHSAREQYNRTRQAVKNAVWEAHGERDPQPGEAWRVFLPYSTDVKAAIPAIKTARGWITDPAYCGGDDLTDADDGYLTESIVFPLERVLEASPIEASGSP